MNVRAIRRPLLVLASLLLLPFSDLAGAEPPMRAARLGYISGTVSFSPAGEEEWVQAAVNRPLTTGDRLWVDAGSRAELQVGGAAIRLGAATSVTLLNLDDRMAQIQLEQGTLKLRVRRLGQDQIFEVDTPNLAVSMNRAGEFRVDVDPYGDGTAVSVQSGRAEVYGDSSSYTVNAQQAYRFHGTGLSDYERLASRRDDDLDAWSRERERLSDNSPSARYVSGDVVGYEDLDANGSWQQDPEYGDVWAPNRVASGWTPFRDGHWSWVDPWGWTWVDDAPWGYAVSHYGRWANSRGSWVWVPGPRREQAVYAPAQVVFVGGRNFQGAVIGSAIAALIGWFPLAPREVYQPSYPVSRGYFDRINRSNAVIPPSSITDIYNTTIVNKTTNVTKVVYVNQRVTGAVVAVPAQAFTRSQPVAKAAVQVSKEAAASAPATHVAAIAPVEQSLHGGTPIAGARPPAHERRVIARTAPPAPPAAFAVQQQQLAARPGSPIDDAQRKQLKPAAAAPPAAAVVTTAQAPAPSAPPPATPPAVRPRDERKADAARGEQRKAEVARPDAAKAEAGRRDAGNADAARTATERADAAKAAAARAETSRAEAAKAEAARADAVRAAAARVEASRADAAKAEAARANAANADAVKAAAARAEVSRAEATRAEAARADAAKAREAKAEASRADAAKAREARAEAVKAEAARNAVARAEAAKGEAANAEAAKAAREKARTPRPEAPKVDDEKNKREEEPRRR